MSGTPEDAGARPDEAPGAKAVADYLRRHPDFLTDHPDLIAVLTPPSHHQGEGVVDLQRFMLESLREELGSLRSREERLLDAAEERGASQYRVQEAALAILEARSFEHLIRTINERIADLLGIASVRLCVESARGVFHCERDLREHHCIEYSSETLSDYNTQMKHFSALELLELAIRLTPYAVVGKSRFASECDMLYDVALEDRSLLHCMLCGRLSV